MGIGAGFFLTGAYSNNKAVIFVMEWLTNLLCVSGPLIYGPCKALRCSPGLFMLFGDLKGLVVNPVFMTVPESAAGPQGLQPLVMK